MKMMSILKQALKQCTKVVCSLLWRGVMLFLSLLALDLLLYVSIKCMVMLGFEGFWCCYISAHEKGLIWIYQLLLLFIQHAPNHAIFKVIKDAILFISPLLLIISSLLLFRYIKFVVSIVGAWVKFSVGGVFYSVLSIVGVLFALICKVAVCKKVINFFRCVLGLACRPVWEPVAWCLRIINVAFCYVANKHLSILFGAMLVVVIGVAGIISRTTLLECVKKDLPNSAFEESYSEFRNREVLYLYADIGSFFTWCSICGYRPYSPIGRCPSNVKLAWCELHGAYFDFLFGKSDGYVPVFVKERGDVKFSYLLMWGIDRMFSYENTRRNIGRWNEPGEGNKGIAIIAFALFLFTWFVGGGVLVSALIATTIEIWSGKWRVWGILLRNHTVILGWDDTVPVLLKEHIESHKKIKLCRPETIVIMTEYPAHKVRSALRDVLCVPLIKGVLRRPIAMVSTVVCNGKFDDEDEIRGLCLQRANSIYVVGEKNDPSHDVRVLMAPKKIESYSNSLLQKEWFQFDTSRLNCHLNIRSLHLFWQHIRGAAKLGDNKVCLRPLNIVPHNFYDSWVKHLFSMVPVNGKNKGGDLHLAFHKNYGGDVHLVIVGFGYFGQALAVEAAAIAHYGKDRRTYITVIDDDIGEKERDFRALFPRIDEITDVYLSFITDVKIGSEKFRELLKGFARNAKGKEESKDNKNENKKQQLTIALTMENDEDCLKQVLPIYKAIGEDDGDAQLIVSQQSCETDLNSSEETFVGMYGCNNVKFFGFCNGAGFGAWRRERHARETFSAPEHNYYKWYNLGERSRQYRRMMFDCIEELYRDKNKEPDIMGVAKAACLLHGIEMSEEEIKDIEKFKEYYNKTFS